VQDKRTSSEQIGATQLVAVSDADRGITPRDQGATADARLASSNRESGHFLTTVLMTDIVDSTRTVARLGDERWRKLLAEHYADCRVQVDHAGGRLVNTTGDGILAIFDAPGRAVRAAIAIQAVARASGLAVRTGVHTGECAWLADSLAGLAVHVAARICALGKADGVMASTTVRDLATESMLTFEPLGRHELKGVPGEWTVFKAGDAMDGSPTRDRGRAARQVARPGAGAHGLSVRAHAAQVAVSDLGLILVGLAIATGIVGIVVPVLPGAMLAWAAIAVWDARGRRRDRMGGAGRRDAGHRWGPVT
jgi:class 3 adenylate cyclase